MLSSYALRMGLGVLCTQYTFNTDAGKHTAVCFAPRLWMVWNGSLTNSPRLTINDQSTWWRVPFVRLLSGTLVGRVPLREGSTWDFLGRGYETSASWKHFESSGAVVKSEDKTPTSGQAEAFGGYSSYYINRPFRNCEALCSCFSLFRGRQQRIFTAPELLSEPGTIDCELNTVVIMFSNRLSTIC